MDHRATAARLGRAVFERIAQEGLLNRELIEDALYRELLVIGAEPAAPPQITITGISAAPPSEFKAQMLVLKEGDYTSEWRAPDDNANWGAVKTDKDHIDAAERLIALAMHTAHNSDLHSVEAWLDCAFIFTHAERFQGLFFPELLRETFYKTLNVNNTVYPSFYNMPLELRKTWYDVFEAGYDAWVDAGRPEAK